MTHTSFRWLHFSDLHFGMDDQKPLWSNLKHHLYDDIDLLHQQSGPWDLVIFSGDIVQKGAVEEFRGATGALKELYERLGKLGPVPRFFAVPGNHDLVRPDEADMAAMLLQDWASRSTVRDSFLNDPASKYRTSIESYLHNYKDWYDGLPDAGIPTLDAVEGLLPGDLAGRLVKDGRGLGVVGLNSTWLQLGDGSKAGDLHVDLRQLSEVLPDAEGWCRANDFNLLVTHQPLEWLCPGSQETWRREIAPPGRFDLHLFGHMHEPLSSSLSSMGSSLVTIFQSPSLFGLQYLADESSERIHGYSAGELSIADGDRQLRIWPRIHKVTRTGQGRMVPNTDFILEDHVSTVTSLRRKAVTVPLDAGAATPVGKPAAKPKAGTFAATTSMEAREILARFRHHLLPPGPHASARKVEQDAASRALDQRCLWIVADWGLSSDEFVSSVLASRSMTRRPVYRLDLGDIPAVGADLDQEIEAKLGFKIQQLSEELAAAGDALLLLDDIALGERPRGGLPREVDLERMAQTMLDYCPSLMIVMRTCSDPANIDFGKVRIAPLDEADLKGYIYRHTDGGEDLAVPEVVDQLLAMTGGVPDRVDAALRALKVVTLSELVASHEEGGDKRPSAGPQPLLRAIEELDSASHPALQRALQLLQALATFPYGAQFEHIKRFNGAHGFYPDNATELRQRALIITSTLPGLEQQSVVETRRIMSVPRIVRDVVRDQMSAELLDYHNRRAAELYFGSNWRAGSTSWPPYRKYSSPKCSHHEIANASSILMRLLKTAMQAVNQDEMAALMHLAAAYGDALLAGSHYYGATGFCASFLHTAPMGIADEMISRVRLCHGKSLRMVGERAKAIEIMEGLDPSLLDKSDYESLLVNLSLAYSSQDNNKATEVAEKLLRSTKSVPYKIQARSIIIQAKPATPERRSKLIALEREARKKKCWVVANNLALALAKQSEDLDEVNRYLGTVVNTGTETEDIYNVVRATVEFSERSVRDGDTLHNDDHSRLISAYQYLFIQRIPLLFDRCHGALWKSFVQRGEYSNLLALFRHSSFIWRIRGVAPKEDQYIAMFLKILENLDAGIPDNRDGGYFRARLPGNATTVEPARLPAAK